MNKVIYLIYSELLFLANIYLKIYFANVSVYYIYIDLVNENINIVYYLKKDTINQKRSPSKMGSEEQRLVLEELESSLISCIVIHDNRIKDLPIKTPPWDQYYECLW